MQNFDHNNRIKIWKISAVLQSFSDVPKKYTQIGIFGMKKYHLATLVPNLERFCFVCKIWHHYNLFMLIKTIT
jgi:hypothetical protein